MLLAMSSQSDGMVTFFTSPIMIVILLMIGIAGVAIELLVPGLLAPGIIGVAALSVFFISHYFAGFADMMDIVAFIVGLVLLLSELFIPSYGILGITGGISLISGIVMATPDGRFTFYALLFATFLAVVIIVFVVQKFKHRAVWNKMILKETLSTDEGFVAQSSKQYLIGQLGMTVTPLRPAGTAKFGHERIDVVTDGQFIMPNTPVLVIKVEGTRVVVDVQQ